MSRLIPRVAIAALIAAAVLVPGEAKGAASIVVGTSICGVIDSTANCVVTPFTAVSTNNVKGVEIERYSADGVFNDTGHAVVFNFADFGPPFGFCVSELTRAVTERWTESLSANGHASIVCLFKS